jgi:hypothetical protein
MHARQKPTVGVIVVSRSIAHSATIKPVLRGCPPTLIRQQLAEQPETLRAMAGICEHGARARSMAVLAQAIIRTKQTALAT